MKNKRQKIFLTGASGFIGSFLVDQLIAKKYDLIILKHRKKLPLIEKKKVKFIKADLLRPSTLRILRNEKFDTVIHMVGGGSISSIAKKDCAKIKKLNYTTTLNLINHLPKTIKRFVYFSSLAAMGVKHKKPIIEINNLSEI